MIEPRLHKQEAPRVLAGRVHPVVSQRWPLFGRWLPLLALYDPPCRRDGSPWDGRDDPGFRITTLTLGWLGHGVSITLGAPRPSRPAHSIQAEQRASIVALDEQIREARTRDGTSD